MRRNIIYFSLLILLFVFGSPVLAADHHESAPQMTGFRAEMVGQIQFAQGRITQLEQAVPADKFTWRPADGVRSISEVYIHIASSNYLLIKTSGQPVPADISIDGEAEAWEKSTTDKDEIKKILDRSFADLLTAVKNISDADLEKTVQVFGMEMSLRNFLMSMLGHMHEHLGQSIAYARSNGITPPWTAAQQKATEQ